MFNFMMILLPYIPVPHAQPDGRFVRRRSIDPVPQFAGLLMKSPGCISTAEPRIATGPLP
jgi:hypothetical protein